MIGERIKQIRNEKGLSQQAFADILSTSSGYICDVEKGKSIPGGALLSSLRREFNVDINWLLTGEGQAPEKRPSPIIAKLDREVGPLDEKDQKDVLKYAQEKRERAELKAAAGRLRQLDPTTVTQGGAIAVNLLNTLALPPMIILAMVGYNLISGAMALCLFSKMYILYIPVLVSLFIYWRTWFIFLKSKYVSFANFGNIGIGGSARKGMGSRLSQKKYG
jgi:transcriptional regulator with XRE-family HTH domain